MVPILAPPQLLLLGEQWRMSPPLMGTCAPQGLLSGCWKSGPAFPASHPAGLLQLGDSLAVTPCVHQLFQKAVSTEGGCWLHVVFLDFA